MEYNYKPMSYTINLYKDDEKIKEFALTAEEVIELLLKNPVPITIEGTPFVIDESNVEKVVKDVRKKITGKLKGNKPQTCSKCGTVGHRADRCTEKNSSKKDTPATSRISHDDEEDAVAEGALDRRQYSEIKELKASDMNSREVAEELEVDVDEVNFIFSSLSYEGYLRLR